MFTGFVGGFFVVLLFLGCFLGVLSFFLSATRFLGCLVVLENMNVLLLGCCLLSSGLEVRSCFLGLLVMFTIEAVLGLVILTRVWSVGSLVGSLGW